jgi:thiamine-monophosphate kinase
VDEFEAIARLRRIATDPAARGLSDDAALFDGLVITHDSIAEGVHYLPFDPPASVGWKLVAVNLSDLAAKGAAPAAALLSLTLTGDGEWEDEFIGGVGAAPLAARSERFTATSFQPTLAGGSKGK